jgi:hypothetical protein
VRFFFDANVPPSLVESVAVMVAAERLNYSVTHHNTLFPDGTLDPQWLRRLGTDGDWIIISGDVAISRKRSAERLVWEQTGLTAFFLGRGFTEQSRWNQLEQLAQWWPGIIRVARGCRRGSGWLMQLRCKEPELLYDPESLR